MRSKATKMIAGLAAVAALALGGSAIASANQHAPQSQTTGGVQQQSGGTAADATAEATNESTAAESTESAGVESAGVESAAANDGPGGHADNPADASVNYDFQGVQ